MNAKFMAAMEELVSQAMGSGAMYILSNVDRMRSNPNMPLTDVLDNYPAEWLRIRRGLVEDVLEAIEVAS